MAGKQSQLRIATPDDVHAIARLESASWPDGLAANTAQVAERVATFPEGQWITIDDGDIVGYSSAQRVPRNWFATLKNEGTLCYDMVTDNNRFRRTHIADGEWYQLVGVATAPALRGRGLARLLIDHQVAHGHGLPGVEKVVGFTRPVAVPGSSGSTLQDHVASHMTGSLRDPVLGFHLDAGAHVVSLHPGFRLADVQSHGSAVLIEYPPLHTAQ